MEERLEITPESKAGCLQGLLSLTTTAMLFKCSYWTETRHLPFSVSTPNSYLLISQKSVSITNTECLRGIFSSGTPAVWDFLRLILGALVQVYHFTTEVSLTGTLHSDLNI